MADTNPSDICTECFDPIKVTIFRGSGFCGENCRKKHNGENEIPIPSSR